MPPPLTFIVNVFKFFDRKDLEIISKTGKYVNRIVRKHFPSKPYRFLNDVSIDISQGEGGLGILFTKYVEDESSGSLYEEIQSFGSQDAEIQSSGSQDAENQSSGSQDAEIQSSGSQDAENQSSGSQDAENQSSGSQDAENQSSGSQDAENQSSGSQDAENQSSGSQIAENQSSGGQDAENQSSGGQDAENQSSGSHDAENQSSGSQDADDESSENQDTGALYLNPYKNEWVVDYEYCALEVMRPFLSQFVRFKDAQLFCDEHPYTPEDMTILASISHVWSGRYLLLSVNWKGIESHLEPPMNFRDNVSNSLHNILSNDAIFSSRCLKLHAAAKFVSLHDYYRIYTLDVLLLTSYNDEHLNISALLALIKHKPQFPESKTLFVVDILTFETQEAEVTDAIRKSFSSASTPCPFQLVIVDDESNGESEEFRLENGTTREVLQLKNVKKDSVLVTKICEISKHVEFYAKFSLIERSRF
ncbi:replicase polyprotein 1a [Ditylenchus destructor]|nr:replicase polyprotein 1a [Ditylenchus destructor]